MPDNTKEYNVFDYSPNLQAGRHDLQAACQLFLDTLFAGCTVLDVGAGLGQSKQRIRHNTVTTYDIDERLRPFVDVAGGPMPKGPFDIVTSFDVIEHVEDDTGFIQKIANRAELAAFIVTPNWHVSKCESTHHAREYTARELIELAATVWPREALMLFGYFKDAVGAWFDLIPEKYWEQHRGPKHGLLVVRDGAERARVDGFFAGRWSEVVQPAERWVPQLRPDDHFPEKLTVLSDYDQ